MKILYSLAIIAAVILLAAFGSGTLPGQYIFGIAVPYAAILIFLAGFVYRIINWAKKPVPYHIPAVCGQQKSLNWIKNNRIESSPNTTGTFLRMAFEVLFFRSLFRNEKADLKNSKKLIISSNKFLWLGGLVFHWSLLVIIIRHARFFLQPVPQWILSVQSLDGFFKSPVTVLYITDVTIVAAITYLFVRRIASSHLRYISLLSDYFALLLIGSIAATGVLMALVYKVDLETVKELILGLVSFHPVLPAGIDIIFYVHFLLVSSLIAYLPFSKLMHMPGILFSPTRNLPNNSRARRHINPVDKPVPVHTYAEWESEFHDVIKGAGLPLEKD